MINDELKDAMKALGIHDINMIDQEDLIIIGQFVKTKDPAYLMTIILRILSKLNKIDSFNDANSGFAESTSKIINIHSETIIEQADMICGISKTVELIQKTLEIDANSENKH